MLKIVIIIRRFSAAILASAFINNAIIYATRLFICFAFTPRSAGTWTGGRHSNRAGYVVVNINNNNNNQWRERNRLMRGRRRRRRVKR